MVAFEGDILRRHFATIVLEVHPEFTTAGAREALDRQLDGLGFAKVDALRKVAVFARRVD